MRLMVAVTQMQMLVLVEVSATQDVIAPIIRINHPAYPGRRVASDIRSAVYILTTHQIFSDIIHFHYPLTFSSPSNTIQHSVFFLFANSSIETRFRAITSLAKKSASCIVISIYRRCVNHPCLALYYGEERSMHRLRISLSVFQSSILGSTQDFDHL